MKTAITILILLATLQASAQYTLTLNMTGVDPHTNMMLFVRVVNITTYKEVANIQTVITSPSVSVSVLSLQGGASYNVDFYIDYNMNGIYDPPPTDHAWRLNALNVTSNVVIDFVHNVNFVDIEYPNKPPVIPIRFESVWSGSWYNETFQSDGSSSATFVFDSYSNSMTGSLTMNGSLGGEFPISIIGSGYYNAETDSSEMVVAVPFQGTLFFVRGKMYGTVSVQDYNLTVTFNGNYGSDQIMYGYSSAGAYPSTGWSILAKQQVTTVSDERKPHANEKLKVTKLYPQPGLDYISISWDPEIGTVSKVIINGIIGDVHFPQMMMSQPGQAVVDISTLPNGVYGVIMETPGNVMRTMLLK